MTSVLCVDCKLPICVSSDPNNKVAFLDPCGHFVHARCGKIMFGIDPKTPNNNQNLPQPTKTAKCRHCNTNASNMYIIFAAGSITGQSEAKEGDDQVDRHPELRITAELKADLKQAEEEASRVREVAEKIRERKILLASREQDLARERDSIAAVQSALSLPHSDYVKNKTLTEVRLLARTTAAEVDAHHQATKHRKNTFVNPLEMQNAIEQNQTKSREMERELQTTMYTISSQGGDLKLMKNEEHKLKDTVSALQRLLGQGGNTLNTVSFDDAAEENQVNQLANNNNNNNNNNEAQQPAVAAAKEEEENDDDALLSAVLSVNEVIPSTNNKQNRNDTNHHKKMKKAKSSHNTNGVICIALNDGDDEQEKEENETEQEQHDKQQKGTTSLQFFLFRIQKRLFFPFFRYSVQFFFFYLFLWWLKRKYIIR